MRTIRVLATALAAVLLLAGLTSGGLVASARLASPAPRLTPAVKGAAAWVPAPGVPPVIPPPTQGSLAVDAVVGSVPRHLSAVDAGVVRPIASVTKTMTALVILEEHPLALGAGGPVLTMTAQDVGDYTSIAAQGGSVAPVSLGEQLTERDLLLGLMLPSANNMALTLARWAARSVPAFVARLNARAAALGMAHTHFADPDGLDAATTSTAADLVLLGEAAMANDSLVGVVSTATATLPGGTTLSNLDVLLGSEPGWLGVKTGWTPLAGGCLLFAARRTVSPGAPPLTIIGAVLDQAPDRAGDPAHPELGGDFSVARAAVEAAYAGYTTVAAAAIPASGSILSGWGGASVMRVRASERILVRMGDTLAVSATASPVAVPAVAGSRAGSVRLLAGGTVVGRWPLVTVAALTAPSAWWRLLHG